jgi:hypothetical protein
MGNLQFVLHQPRPVCKVRSEGAHLKVCNFLSWQIVPAFRVARATAGFTRAVRPNPSIERTNNGWRACAVLRAVRGPLFAAHVER